MRGTLQAEFGGANFIHRYLWKYQAWLNGYNGGPLRQPAMKLADGQMRRAAEGLIRSGLLESQPSDLGAFFDSRNPA
jgi:4-hydroxy-tetrahydrodipicolinate synthase